MVDDLTVDSVFEGPKPWGVLLRRGLRKKCPRCGGGHLYRGWFHMKDRCPTCGFLFEREPGFFVSAAFINFAVTEGALFLVLMGVIFTESQNVDASLVTPLVAGGILAVLCPVAFYPFSRTIWSAIDLSMSPLELEEIIAARDYLATMESATAGPEAPVDRGGVDDGVVEEEPGTTPA